MGRQISFVHSEADTYSLLERIYELDANIIIDGKCLPQKETTDIVIDRMASHEFQFLIVPSNKPFEFFEKRRGECILNGVAVEFSVNAQPHVP